MIALSLPLAFFLGISGGHLASKVRIVVVSDLEVGQALRQAANEFMRETGIEVEIVFVPFEDLPHRSSEACLLIWQEGEDRALFSLLDSSTETLLGKKRFCLLVRQGNPRGITQLGDLSLIHI